MKNLSKKLSFVGLIVSLLTTPTLANNFGGMSVGLMGAVGFFFSIISCVSTFIIVMTSSRSALMALFVGNSAFAVMLGISYLYMSITGKGPASYLIAPLVWFTVNIIIITFKPDFPQGLRMALGYGAVPFVICGILFCISWKTAPAPQEKFFNEMKKQALADNPPKIHKAEQNDGGKSHYQDNTNESNKTEDNIKPQENIMPKKSNADLIPAIMGGESQRVAELIAQGVDVNQKNQNGFTPLMMAAIYGHTEIAKQLLDAKADVNAFISVSGANEQNLTALYMAKANNHPEIAELLKAAGAKEDGIGQSANKLPKDEKDNSMLWACIDGDTEKVKELLAEGVKPTPHHLKVAAQHERSEVLKQLLAAGVNVNEPDEEGEYALLSVVNFGSVEDLELFMRYGADLTVDYPAKSGGYIGPALVLAALMGDLPKVKYLVEHNGDINLPNKSGSTPLLVASSKGHKDIVSFLIKNGASVNTPNNHKDTALMVAAESGDIDTVKHLLDAGAEVNVQNKHNDTALMFAMATGKTEMVKLLLAAGADVNLRDVEGNTALSIARDEGHKEIVELLKRAGA